ncbi:hypothetical protein V865_006484 [Kwoniella europaea PYCC6329]|uniref:Zn(2)-C6 fungal-type domain-containing protein n=1 Tax=Kwoniella europaea PYCC6329 TaxID=1423913 RepID=A0AAX4KPN2_9TREE
MNSGGIDHENDDVDDRVRDGGSQNGGIFNSDWFVNPTSTAATTQSPYRLDPEMGISMGMITMPSTSIADSAVLVPQHLYFRDTLPIANSSRDNDSWEVNSDGMASCPVPSTLAFTMDPPALSTASVSTSATTTTPDPRSRIPSVFSVPPGAGRRRRKEPKESLSPSVGKGCRRCIKTDHACTLTKDDNGRLQDRFEEYTRGKTEEWEAWSMNSRARKFPVCNRCRSISERCEFEKIPGWDVVGKGGMSDYITKTNRAKLSETKSK